MSRECPGCAIPADRGAETCPICGYEFPRHPRRFWVVAIPALVGFAVFLLAGVGSGCHGW